VLWEVSQGLARMLGRDVDLLDLRAASTVMQCQVLITVRRLWAAGVQAGLFECCGLSEKTALDEARADLLADVYRRGRVYGRGADAGGPG
jgi:hypothetical protein